MLNSKERDLHYSDTIKDVVMNRRDRRANKSTFFILNMLALLAVSFLGFKLFNKGDGTLETKVLGVVHKTDRNISEGVDIDYSSHLDRYISEEIKNSKGDRPIMIERY